MRESSVSPGPPPAGMVSPTPPPAPPESAERSTKPNASRMLGWRGVTLLMIGIGGIGGVGFLASQQPGFYAEQLQNLSAEDRVALSKQFLNKGTRLINDIQNQSVWAADFEQDQINAWLAEDFESNHAEQSLPTGTGQPRLALDGDVLRLGFRFSKGPFGVIIQIGFRAWVPRRSMLAVEIEGAKAGWLPLPSSYTRSVIEQFAYANSMEVTWKRNGQRLVALFEFPRGHREVVLQKVEIKDGAIHLRGGSGRLPVNSKDYSPSAN